MSKSSKSKKQIVDVRIVDVGSLPPQYFLHEAVISALRDVVRSEVVAKGKKVPPGAQAIYSDNQYVYVRNKLQGVQVRSEWRLYAVIIFLLVVVAAGFMWMILFYGGAI